MKEKCLFQNQHIRVLHDGIIRVGVYYFGVIYGDGRFWSSELELNPHLNTCNSGYILNQETQIPQANSHLFISSGQFFIERKYVPALIIEKYLCQLVKIQLFLRQVDDF
jgi:hypothetical protein